MKEIADAEEIEIEAAKRKKQGGSRQKASQEISQDMGSELTFEDHDDNYDDFVSFNFDIYRSFNSYFKLNSFDKLINIYLLTRLII
jgi:hypothetical protein